MNISMQLSALAILCTIIIFYKRHKRMLLDSEAAFSKLLGIVLISVILDAASLLAIEYAAKLPEVFVNMLCKMYLLTIIGGVFVAMNYICVEIYKDVKRRRKVLWVGGALTIAGMAATCILPIQYNNDDIRALYTLGPSVVAAYVMAVFLLAFCLVILIKGRADAMPKKYSTMLGWVLLWIVVGFVQYFIREMLILGFVSALGVLILYLRIENPEINLDWRTGFYNTTALIESMKERYRKKEIFSLLVMVLEPATEMTIYESKGEGVNLEVRRFLKGLDGCIIYKNVEDETILLFEDPLDADNALMALQKRFDQPWGETDNVFLRPGWIYMPNMSIVNDAEDVLYLLRYVKQTSKDFVEHHFLKVDKRLVLEMHGAREVEQLLNNAINNDRVEVYYQPIYSTKDGRFTSAEALMRIRDEDGRVIMPGVFIQVAEQNGMILKLGEIVFDKVCQFLKKYPIERMGIDYIEVNLSMVQCAYEYLADSFIAIMKRHAVDPRWINLEITESASINAKKVLLNNMKILIDYGIHFSLDDFGTGQSNLNYIVEMPVQIIKFDRGLSSAYFQNNKVKYVMDAALSMIHGMKLEIVTEGIETEEQFEVMRGLGINYIQGFFFSKPLPEQEFVDFICESNGIAAG